MAVILARGERLGFEVAEAGDGQEALDRFAALPRPDCEAVLMYIQMPDLDGCQTTTKLRERYPSEELPMIAMTAAVLAENRAAALAAGMNEFVTKPFEIRQLETVLRRWIRPRLGVAGTATLGMLTRADP